MARLSESGEDDGPVPSATDRLREPWFSAEAHDVDTDAPVVKVHGEVDMATAPQLAKAVTEVLEMPPRTLVFDLTEVTFLDSSGIKVLLHARRPLPEEGSVVLRRPQPAVLQVLEITDLAGLFVVEV